MAWALFSVYFLLCLYIVWRHPFFRLQGLHRSAPLAFFILKIVAGLAIWYVYTFYYPQREYADIWKYYDDSEIVYNALDSHPADYFKMMSGIGIDENIQHAYFDKMRNWDQKFENNLFNDSHTIIRFNALLRLISGGNYHTHSLFMCLLAFIGLCALYHWLYKFLWQWKRVVAFILFVSPSLLFWSSGVLKEGILFFALGMLILHAWRFADDRKRYRLIWITISVFLLAMTKLYILVFIGPSLLLGIHLIRNPRFAFAKCCGTILLLTGIAFGIHKVKPELSPFRIIALKQIDFLTLAKGGTYIMDQTYVVFVSPDQQDHLIALDSARTQFMIGRDTKIMYWVIADNFKDTLYRTTSVEKNTYTLLNESPVAGSLMNVQPLKPTPASVLSASLPAFARSTFRPYPWEVKPVMIIPPMLENLLLYLLLLLLLFAWKKPSSKAVLWFCLLYAVIALTVTGLTTPVLGALVRYRIVAVPFLLFAILCCLDKEKLVKKLPVLRNIL